MIEQARANFKLAYEAALANTQVPFRKAFLNQYYEATLASIAHRDDATATLVLNASTLELKH